MGHAVILKHLALARKRLVRDPGIEPGESGFEPDVSAIAPVARVGAPGGNRILSRLLRRQMHGPSCCGCVLVIPAGIEPASCRIEAGRSAQRVGTVKWSPREESNLRVPDS